MTRYIEPPVVVRSSVTFGLSSDLFHQYKGEDSNTMCEIKSPKTFSTGIGREMREEIRGELEIQITQLTGEVTDERRSRVSIPFRRTTNKNDRERHLRHSIIGIQLKQRMKISEEKRNLIPLIGSKILISYWKTFCFDQSNRREMMIRE